MADDIILILEDDEQRITRFTRALEIVAPNLPVVFWRSARQMMHEVLPYLHHARLISLDHDLYPPNGSTEDPGDGLEIAKFLAPSHFTCPIIIHSSNGDRARMMAGEFELAGHTPKLIAPLGNDWIESYWAKIVQGLLYYPPQ